MRVDIPLIDVHTHIGRLPGVVGDQYSTEDLCYIAEQEGVRFMLVSSATATTVSQSSATDEVIAMMRDHGDLLGGMLWINPHDPAWRDDIDRAVEAGFSGIKIHPVLDHYQVTRAALDEVFSVAEAHNWPILTHTDVDGSPASANTYVPLIDAYPTVPLILAHLRLESIPLAKRHENVFLDSTYVDAVRVELGVDALGPTKILYGSDACEGFEVGHVTGRIRPGRSHAGLIQALRDRGIGDNDLVQMTYHNARALFDLDV